MIGLDPFGYNLLEYSLSGPLLFKKDSSGKKTDPLVGFFIAGNATHTQDGRPSALGNWKVKDDVMEDLINDPLRYATAGTGTFQNAEFLRLNQLERIKTRQNVANRGLNLQGKLDFNVGETANLTFGGNISYSNDNGFDRSYALFNSDNNPVYIGTDWRVFGRFTQRFADEENENASASTIKNIFYSIQLDYQRNTRNQWDETHRDNLFDYGYVGKFKTLSQIDYEPGVDSVSGFPGNVHVTFLDTLVAFEPGTQNPIAASYTKKYYELYGWDFENSDIDNGIYSYDNALAGNNLRNLVDIQTFGGLRNGDYPAAIYSLWRSPAFQYPAYSNYEQNQFRASALGSGDIGNHAISVGFEYEKRTDRQYYINPVELWTMGRQYVNNHITNLDRDNVIVESNGSSDNSVYYTYGRLNSSPGEYDRNDDIEPQYFFDYNMRKALGLDPDGTDFIDFDSYDPETFNVNFFSADELMNNSTDVVTYYGYDHTGNRMSSIPSFDDFFNERDEFGNYTRPIAPFSPVYMAGFIQDKFTFDDLVFNVGVRTDMYDASQQVLIDDFVLFPTVKAGEDLTDYGIEGFEKPETIGDDYVVYVDDLKNPTTVLGYRNENTWYNSEGTEMESGATLRTANGIAPLLVDPSNTNGKDLTSSSFVDYKPQVNVMPRVAFSFPISDEALFFAHYDVLTKRPTTGMRLDPTQYFFIETLGSNPLNNPNLKPEKTIDYELGFQQKLNNTSSIKLAAFYRELRDLVQVVNMVDAYPKTYISYQNLDFATVKGATVTYDLRRTGNIWAKVAYTLQFAEGTGSNSSSGLNLARSNKPNLRVTNPLSYDQRHGITATIDYRYASGVDYNGPYLGERQILANTGVNFVFNTGSGTPYNRRQFATNAANIGTGLGSAPLDGRIYGSRLPWTYRFDARLDRDMTLSFGGDAEGNGGKQLNLNVYLWVLNVFNTLNITQVYSYTGDPADDGFLVDPRYQKDIEQQNNEQSYRELYSIKVNDPANFALPRRIRLGVSVNF